MAVPGGRPERPHAVRVYLAIGELLGPGRIADGPDVRLVVAQGLQYFQLARPRVAVLADVEVEPQYLAEALHIHAGLTQEVDWQDRGLGRVRGAERQALVVDVGQRIHPAIGPGDEYGRKVRVHVAHGQGPAGPARPLVHLHPGQVGVPTDVDLPVEQGLHLAVVVGKQNVVDRRSGFAEVVAHGLPDGDDPRVVGHRAN